MPLFYATSREAIAELASTPTEDGTRTRSSGDILPLALGVTIHPIPIIAAILMLPAPKARGPSVGFLTGWVIGIAVAVTAFTLLASVITKRDPDASKPVARTIKIPLRSCSSSSR